MQGLPPYVAHQLAQTEHLRQQGAGLKLGWAWPGALQDERYFDDLHARELGVRIDSVYVSGGTTLDPRRPRACPYVCSDPDARLLLRAEEPLERKLRRAPAVARQRYERLLGKLVRAHCQVTGAPRPRCATAVLQDQDPGDRRGKQEEEHPEEADPVRHLDHHEQFRDRPDDQ